MFIFSSPKKVFVLNSNYGSAFTLALQDPNKEGLFVKNQMTFQRYELKYLLNFHQLQAVLDAMKTLYGAR